MSAPTRPAEVAEIEGTAAGVRARRPEAPRRPAAPRRCGLDVRGCADGTSALVAVTEFRPQARVFDRLLARPADAVRVAGPFPASE